MGLDIITLTIAELLSKYGYYGLFAGSFLSSLFLPIGADILLSGCWLQVLILGAAFLLQQRATGWED